MRIILLAIALLFLNINLIKAQTVGLLSNTGEVQEGYVLFNGGPGGGGPGGGTKGSYLINTCGELINSWLSIYDAGLAVYLDYDGNLIRPIRFGGQNSLNVGGGGGGGIEMMDWAGNVIWTYDANELDFFQHHDIEPLPNGNVLFISWESRTSAESQARGRQDNATLIPTRITEVEPVGANGANVIWEWKAFDHTVQDVDASLSNYGVIADNPQLLDINLDSGQDWLHCNGIDYIEEYDLIVVSSKDLNEIFVIDHSTTTAEAAGHTGGTYGKGGDLLYRWGNPENYDQGTSADLQMSGQHGVRWLPNANGIGGKFGIFNNNLIGLGLGYSYVIAIEAPMNADGSFIYTAGTAYGPSNKLIDEAVPEAFTGSNVVPLENGNYFYCVNSFGHLGEFNAAGDLVWEYKIPVDAMGPMEQGEFGMGSSSFNAERYNSDFVGFVGKDLSPQGLLEGSNVLTEACIYDSVFLIPPVANFTFQIIDDNQVDFTNISSGDSLVSYFWDFDNGMTSTEENPGFTFDTTGTYNVCLTITNVNGDSDTNCQEIYIYFLNIDDISYDQIFSLYPNPSDDQVYINTIENNYSVTIYNNEGKEINSFDQPESISLKTYEPGIYFLKMISEKRSTIKKLILK